MVRETTSIRADENAAPAIGPVQVIVIGFEGHDFTGEILPELRRLEELDIVSLVDLLFVEKDDDGEVRAVELSGLSAEERAEFGAIAGALVGLGAGGAEGLEAGALAGALAMEDGAFDEADIWAIADAIPAGSLAAIALLEHRWAGPLREAVARAGGVALADAWIHPLDLVAVGFET